MTRIGLQVLGALRQPPLGKGFGRRFAHDRRTIALGKAGGHEGSRALSPRDVAIRDELAQRLINRIPCDSQIFRQSAA